MKKVGIWLRVSTSIQVLETDSLEHHERRARSYIELRNWDLVTIYRLEGVSGKDIMDHPETRRMLEDIRQGRISGLVFSKLSRLARNTRHLLELAEIFQNHKADLISIGDNIDTSTPSGRLTFVILSALSQWEREQIAERVQASVRTRAEAGFPLGGASPYGYRWEGKELALEPEEAAIRKQMFLLYRKHGKLSQVCDILNSAGHRTRLGRPFSDTTVKRLLTDPIVIGKRRVNYTKSLGDGRGWVEKDSSEWIYVPAPVLIEEELFQAVQDRIESQAKKHRRRGRAQTYLFTGLIQCQHGCAMYRRKRMTSYSCPTHGIRIPATIIEEVYVKELERFLLSPDGLQKEQAEAEVRVKDLAKELRVIERRINTLKEKMEMLISLVGDGTLPRSELRLHYDPIKELYQQSQERKEELEKDIATHKHALSHKEDFQKDALSLAHYWTKLTQEDKRKIIEKTIHEIVVGDQKLTIKLYSIPTMSDVMPVAESPHRDKGS